MAYYNVPDLTIDALTLYIHVFSLRKDTAATFLFGLFVKHFQLLGRSLLLSTKLSNASLDRAEHRKTFDFSDYVLDKRLYKSVLHLLVALLTKLVAQQSQCNSHEQESDNNAKESGSTTL
jgi:hypothetical protein